MATAESSHIDGLVFPYGFSDNAGFARAASLRGAGYLKFWTKVWYGYLKADLRLAKTLSKKECYYGPFKGEFGHFLAHTLPFLTFLHKRGVKIRYCGMSLHAPFLVDENGKSMVDSFTALRDFFAEVAPSANSTVPPADVREKIRGFEAEAKASGLPFWNIGDDFYYWFIHRNWLPKGHTDQYMLEKTYGTVRENACTLFPRSKSSTKNHGTEWDYNEVINRLIPHFDRIYLCGHPSQVKNLTVNDPKVEIAVSTDNRVTLEKTSRSRLIVTQHSGAVYLGEYTGSDVLIIYKGGRSPIDIESLNNTLRFKKQFKGRSKLSYAFDYDEISQFVAKKQAPQHIS